MGLVVWAVVAINQCLYAQRYVTRAASAETWSRADVLQARDESQLGGEPLRENLSELRTVVLGSRWQACVRWRDSQRRETMPERLQEAGASVEQSVISPGLALRPLGQAARGNQDHRSRAGDCRPEWFSRGLCFVAVLLSGALLRAFRQRHVRHAFLEEQGAVEHLIADLSTRISVAPHDWRRAVFDQAIAQLGRGFGADRAYLLFADFEKSEYRWARPGVVWPDGWPRDLLSPALASPLDDDGIFQFATVAQAPDSALRTVLLTGDARSWAAVAILHRGRRVGLVGFDLLREASRWPIGGSGMVRAAGEAIQGALDRQWAPLERRSFQEQLGRARRLETLGAFASGIAHNFNNVVSVVMGHAEMAGEAVARGTAAEYHVREISRAAERAQQLIGSILDYGTRAATDKHAIDLKALLDETMSMLQVTIPEGVTFRMELTSEQPTVLGSAADVQQVILNLVRNSWQAMPDGGEVMLTLDVERGGGDHRLPPDAQPRGEYVRISVRDTGIGMPEPVLARVFEPFFGVRATGTGLGLATVREIVHDLEGTIEVRSTVGAGTVFTIRLPAARSATSASRSC